MTNTPSSETIAGFVRIVGEEHAIRDEAAMEPYLNEWRDRFHGKAALVLKPGSTEEVAAILKLANETRTAIVPQGGNTGLVGGQIPHRGEVVLSLNRLDKIREIDPLSNRVTVGERDDLLKSTLVARQVNVINARLRDADVLPCHAKIRYNHAPQPATVSMTADDELTVRFDEPQSAITPGQAVVLYDGDVVLGGGWIESAR